MNLPNHIEEAVAYIRTQNNTSPKIGLILGSGLGSLADEINDASRIPFADIPNFSRPTVEGHAGQFVFGQLEKQSVVALQGRLHYYEGHDMQTLTLPVRVMRALGVEIMIVTNACGGIRPDLTTGSLMFISDHINFMGSNPLMGYNTEALGPRFPDMSEAYDQTLISLGEKVAAALNIDTHRGVYTGVSGPYYFSRAELRMVKNFGSDAIGMSTVPEVIVARHAGIRVLGISCITDIADPDQEMKPLTHKAVLAVAASVRPKFKALIKGILASLSDNR